MEEEKWNKNNELNNAVSMLGKQLLSQQLH